MQTCPKCGGEMDTGQVQAFVTYVSDKAKTSFLHMPGVRITRANACLNCGYVELYLNSADLEKDLNR